MRTIPDELALSLAGPATTMARCWRLTRADGLVQGFTDHDEALLVDGTRFAAATGMAAGEAEEALGLAAGTQEVEGALTADAIEETAIASGLYDGARVESFAVDWQRPERHMRLAVHTIGEISRTGNAFTAELRGPEAALDRERGRSYRRRCDAALGDRRCRVDLAARDLLREGTVREAAGASLLVGGVRSFDRARFERGCIRAGADLRFERDVAGMEPGETAGEWQVTLAEPLEVLLAAGASVVLAAGCDKTFTTCRTAFGNGVNFRGFPHLPGLDAVLAIAKRDDVHDGSVLVP